MNRRNRGFVGQWNSLCNGGSVSLYILDCARGNPNVNYGLRMITTCQCRFMSYSKRTTLVGSVGGRGESSLHLFKKTPMEPCTLGC